MVVPADETPTAQPTSSSASTVDTTPSATPGTRSTTATPTPLDVTRVDWSAVTLPAAVCQLAAPVTLLHGTALVQDDVRGRPDPGTTGPRYVKVALASGQEPNPVYGDLDGTTDAAVHVWCDNNGGTAAGHLQDSVVVFSGASGALKPLGVALPRHTTDRASLLGHIVLAGGRLTLDESYYKGDDADCCPSGLSHELWTYDQLRQVPAGHPVS